MDVVDQVADTQGPPALGDNLHPSTVHAGGWVTTGTPLSVTFAKGVVLPSPVCGQRMLCEMAVAINPGMSEFLISFCVIVSLLGDHQRRAVELDHGRVDFDEWTDHLD